MAEKKKHPDIGKFVVRYEGHINNVDEVGDDAFDTIGDAIDDYAATCGESGDVVYVYQVVGVKVLRRPDSFVVEDLAE